MRRRGDYLKKPVLKLKYELSVAGIFARRLIGREALRRDGERFLSLVERGEFGEWKSVWNRAGVIPIEGLGDGFGEMELGCERDCIIAGLPD